MGKVLFEMNSLLKILEDPLTLFSLCLMSSRSIQRSFFMTKYKNMFLFCFSLANLSISTTLIDCLRDICQMVYVKKQAVSIT